VWVLAAAVTLALVMALGAAAGARVAKASRAEGLGLVAGGALGIVACVVLVAALVGAGVRVGPLGELARKWTQARHEAIDFTPGRLAEQLAPLAAESTPKSIRWGEMERLSAQLVVQSGWTVRDWDALDAFLARFGQEMGWAPPDPLLQRLRAAVLWHRHGTDGYAFAQSACGFDECRAELERWRERAARVR
jgi:hypothetical protein